LRMRRRALCGKAALLFFLVGLLRNLLHPTTADGLCFSVATDSKLHLDSMLAQRRHQHRRSSVTRRAAPWDFLQGTMVDPGYWKQQYFLAGRLKTFLPDRKLLCALELAPGDAKYIGYMCPAKESGSILDRYIVLGSVDDDLKDTLKKQAEVFRAGVEFRAWERGKRAANLKPESVDAVLLSPGATSRLGGVSGVGAGLAELRKALKFDGRVLIVVGEGDEATLGGRLEGVLEAQDLLDLPDLDDIGMDGPEMSAGQMLRSAGLRLVKVVRDECGLAVGVCLKREAEKAPRAPSRGRARGASGPRRSRPPRRAPAPL